MALLHKYDQHYHWPGGDIVMKVIPVQYVDRDLSRPGQPNNDSFIKMTHVGA